MPQYKPLDKGKYADKVADYFYRNEAADYSPEYKKEALRKLKQWTLRDGNLTEMQRALDYSGNGSTPIPMIEHAHKKMHGKLKKFYKSIVAGSLAIPLLFNIAKASDCNLECNVKKDTAAYETSIEEDSYNSLKIPLPKKENFKYRHTALEETPQGAGILVYDGYSINDPKKEKIDYMVMSRAVFELPQTSGEDKNKSNVYLEPFQYMWIDKEGNLKVAIDIDGKINGNEIDVTEQYMGSVKRFLEQQEKNINPLGRAKDMKIEI